MRSEQDAGRSERGSGNMTVTHALLSVLICLFIFWLVFIAEKVVEQILWPWLGGCSATVAACMPLIVILWIELTWDLKD